MRYVSWAVLYEGASDAFYFDVLLPRVIRDLVAREGVQVVDVPDVPAIKLGARGRAVDEVAAEACDFRDAYDIVFIHADAGGGGLHGRADAYCAALKARCDWPAERCILVTPRRETEAWLLADGKAVTEALGYRGNPAEVGLPGDASAAERLQAPKQVIRLAVDAIAGRRRTRGVERLFPAVAQRQRLDILRGSASFVEFERRLRSCLQALGCVR